jgi:hypothetical protein
MGFININAAAPGTGNAGRALARFGLTADINEILPYMTSTYDALQTTVKRRFSTSTIGLVYTFSKAINFADNDGGPRIQYYPAARQNRGPAGYDRRHNAQAFWVSDLPFGSTHRLAGQGLAAKLLGGFQWNGLMGITSGAPIGVIQGNGFNLNAPGSSQVPDLVKSSVAILDGVGLGNPYFDTAAFAPVNIPASQAQRFGNTGRNSLVGPGFFNIDSGLFRTISVTEHVKMQLRAEALNVLNHPNFANPSSDVSSAGSFGYITQTVGQGSRLWRFAVRFSM